MPKMRAVQVSRAKGPFEIVERDIPEPGSGSVRIKVQACGVCHSDVHLIDNDWGLSKYPFIPGHVSFTAEHTPIHGQCRQAQRVAVVSQ